MPLVTHKHRTAPLTPAQRRLERFRHRSYWRAVLTQCLMWGMLAGLMYVMVYPLLFIVSTSLKTYADMINPTTVWIARKPALSNYATAFTALEYPKVFLNTLTIALSAPLFQLMSCSLAGYGFARFQFREKKLLFGLMIFLLIVPQQVISLPQFILFKGMGMLNTYWPMILPALFGQGLKSGFFIYIFRQFFRGIPKELEDAAYIDGCGFLRTFLRIMLPNAIPAITTVFLFSFVWHFNDIFMTTMFTTDPRLQTLPMRLVNIMSYLFEPGVMRDLVRFVPIKYAGVFLTILPMLMTYVFGQRYFVESVERSGIVG